MAAGATLSLLTAGFVASQPTANAAVDPCTVNPIVCENSKPGTPIDTWDSIWGAGDPNMQGFATDISVNAGQAINFKIKTTASSYTIDIYRLGWYNGDGARKITTINPSANLPQNQPACVSSTATEIYDCGTWGVSASWAVPTTAVSGVYLAKPNGPGGITSQIPFIVRNDASTAPVMFQTSDTTWQAYNDFGGSNMYWGDGANGRAFKVSYNRPFSTRGTSAGRDYLFSNEYPMIRFLERNGYDMTYTTGVDSDRRGNLIRNHKVFLSVGHDEYWSHTQRANVEAARDAGVSLAFFSGNEVYWKTRWENSVDGNNVAHRTLVCYKETWGNGTTRLDPDPQWTGTWRDPRLTPPAIGGGRPENGLTGTAYMANSDDFPIEVPEPYGKLRLWRNTSVATLGAGQKATLAPHTVGYESNEDLDNGFRPAGLIRLTDTVGNTPEYLRDFGKTVSPGTTRHNLTLYRAPSGALVFSAGTIQWAWGLDQQHDGTQSPADPRMQQATVNLLADMGAQPTTLMSGLVAATATTDTTAPTTTITSPANNTTVTNGSAVTISGTAADVGGGRVGGIEVSTDGGTTWHPATGTTSWSYTFHANGVGTQAIRVRATDDSANIATTPASLTLNLSGASTLFGNRVPATPSADDSSAVTLGVKFVPSSNGTVTGIRFYKGSGNTGSHTGTLWTASGTQLATGTFGSETATGWQTLTFSSPVQVTRDTTYIASYYAPNGHYAAVDNFFSAADWTSAPLTAPRADTSGGNGVYRSGNGFPTESFGDTNYYVDVMFFDGDRAAPAVVSTTPITGTGNVDVGTRPTAVFSKAVDQASIVFTLKNASNVAVAGTTSYNATTRTVTFAPTANLGMAQSYTASVTAKDTEGTAMPAPTTWTFSTTAFSTVSTLFATNAVPSTAAVNDNAAVSLGVKFVPNVSGQIVGVRYYQGPGNTGTHTGTLWSSTGTQLAKVTFSGGDGTGWQSGYFATPVNVTAGTTYVVSYYAPAGFYAANSNFFASSVNGPDGALTAPAGSNGVYRYGSDAFPSSTWNSSNYWVDPLFVPGGPIPNPSPSASPSASTSPSATPTPAPPSASATPSASASPSASPTPSTQPTPPGNSVTLFTSTDVPTSPSWNDNSGLEVGVKFTSDVAGSVLGVRFYKGTQNTGTHTGTLWSPTGTQLATATFIGESASGWQTVLFSTPVTITANTTYTVSYHTNVGFYAVTANQFQAGYNKVPLHVAAAGAVYRYGAVGFPSATSNHNYWVDVVFVPGS